MRTTRERAFVQRLGVPGMNALPLTGARLLEAGAVGAGFDFFGFFASRLLRCWPFAMQTSAVVIDRSEFSAVPDDQSVRWRTRRGKVHGDPGNTVRADEPDDCFVPAAHRRRGTVRRARA